MSESGGWCVCADRVWLVTNVSGGRGDHAGALGVVVVGRGGTNGARDDRGGGVCDDRGSPWLCGRVSKYIFHNCHR